MLLHITRFFFSKIKRRKLNFHLLAKGIAVAGTAPALTAMPADGVP
jgi:hypothetical protein